MKTKLMPVILVLAIALVAYIAFSPIDERTDAPAATPEPEPETAVAPTLTTQDFSGPGGVEVALTLVTIPDQENIALVNGEKVSTAAYQEELKRALYSVTAQYEVDWNDLQNASYLPTFQDQVLDEMIDRILLQQLARQEGITADPADVEERIALIQSQVEQDPSFADWESFLAANNLTDDVLRSLIAVELQVEVLAERHGGSPLVEHVHASHILVQTEEEGQEVLDKLAAGEAFDALAAAYSIDPGSKDLGGDLGWFPPGMMVPEFEAAAFSLEPGEISGLVATDFGYHIILVHEKEEREMDPDLYAQVQQQAFGAWYELQQAQADIERLHTFGVAE